jgi:cellobiose-specific phosphotransferase system component IIA
MSEEPKKNGLLQTIFAGGDTSVKILTMALIVISGGGNMFVTKNLTDREKANVKHALEQIYDVQKQLKEIHDILDDINRKH